MGQNARQTGRAWERLFSVPVSYLRCDRYLPLGQGPFGLDGGACLFKASEPSQHVLETDGGQISDQTVVQVWDEK